MPFCVLIVFKWHLGKKNSAQSPFLSSSSYHPVPWRYPVGLEQQLYFHVMIRPLSENKMGREVGGWLGWGWALRERGKGKSLPGNSGAGTTPRKRRRSPGEGLGEVCLHANRATSTKVRMRLEISWDSSGTASVAGLMRRRSHPGALSMNAPALPVSKVQLDHSRHDCRQPRGGMLSLIFSVTCSFGVRLIRLEDKEGSWRCFPSL